MATDNRNQNDKLNPNIKNPQKMPGHSQSEHDRQSQERQSQEQRGSGGYGSMDRKRDEQHPHGPSGGSPGQKR